MNDAQLQRVLTDPAWRDDAIRTLGCIACRLEKLGFVPCEKHHLNAHDMPGGARRGELFTVGLCQWHHVGRCACPGKMMVVRRCPACEAERGPSWHHSKRAFLNRYGSGDELLVVQNYHLTRQARGELS